ncbi:MAG: hypothetical protein SXU28_05655, partial [Pseudomonadota bacterium]|nr:hypothetical protein [Pseudomonadota bacterium]
MTTLTASIEAERKPASISAARVVLAALAFVVLMQLHLAFTKAINWDEYWHYSLITASLRGEEVPFLQTPYIPLFSWVTQLPMAPIEQITLIRAFILAFEVVAAIAVYFAARRFTDHLTALLCALAYVTAGYAFLHGFALRADVIAAAFLTSALAVGLRAKVNLVNAALIGLLLILAVLSTIKSVLWAPAFIAVLVLRADELPASRSIVITALCGVLALVAGFFLFGGEAAENAMGTISRSSERMFSAGLFPLGGYFLKQLIFAPFFTALMGVLVYWLVRGQAERKVKIALALLAAPLLTVVFYRNSFPYYFAFIMPPVAIAIAPAIEIAVRRYGAAMMTAVLVLGAITLNVVEKRDRLDTQRQLQTQLRTVFPKPVIYIDESGMLGDYPRAALRFTSGWSLQRYWDDGE